MPAIKSHHTATDDGAWNAGENVARLFGGGDVAANYNPYHDSAGRDAGLEPAALKTASRKDGMLVHVAGAVTAACWHAMHDGREYLVAPVVALVPGVLNGELVPADEIARYIEAWNDVPVPVQHPERRGKPVSARTLDVLENEVIGRFQNVRWDGRLVGELWLDIAKAEQLGEADLLAALEAGEPVEVSTAYFRDMELAEGALDGVPYESVSRNIRPDHLALLPGGVGACSWADGCGAPRRLAAHEQAISYQGGDVKSIVVQMELSLDEQMRRVYDAFMERFAAPPALTATEEPIAWVREVFADRVIAEVKGQLAAVPYTMTEAGAIEFGDPILVEVIYQPIDAASAPQAMRLTKKHKGGCPCMDETPVVNQEPTEQVEVEVAAEPQTVVPAELLELSQLLADLGGVQSLRDALAGVKANADAARANVIAELVANDRCAFSADELKGMTTATLEKLAQSLRPADYSGRGMPRTHQAGDEWEPYVAEVGRNGK